VLRMNDKRNKKPNLNPNPNNNHNLVNPIFFNPTSDVEIKQIASESSLRGDIIVALGTLKELKVGDALARSQDPLLFNIVKALTENENDKITVKTAVKLVMFMQENELSNERLIQELIGDDFFINYLKFTTIPNNFELGEFDKVDVSNAIEGTVYFNSDIRDIKGKKGAIYANQIKKEATNYLCALNESTQNAFDNLIAIPLDIAAYFDTDDLLESPEEYVSETLKRMMHRYPNFYKLINFKSKFDSDEHEQKQNDDDAYSFSQSENDTFDNEGLRSIEKKEVELESPASMVISSDSAVEVASESSLKSDDRTELITKQWGLLSEKMTIILRQCEKKFTQGHDFINLFLSESTTLIHSDILDKISPRLNEIDPPSEESTTSATRVEKSAEVVTQGKSVVQKYKASLDFIKRMRITFEKLKTIYGEALASNNIDKMDSCVKTLSDLLQLGAALYSPVHLTHFTIKSDVNNNLNQTYAPLEHDVMVEYGLSINPGVNNYEWLQSILEKGVGGAKIVSGASTIASIFSPFAINVSLLSEDNATPLLSLTCASGIEEKNKILKNVFDESQSKKEDGPGGESGDRPLPRGPPRLSLVPPSQIDCGSFESLFFARDGKLGEFLQICVLSILKFTTLLQKAGDSQMPIQVGVENLMKNASNAIDCFMHVYDFVARWCKNITRIKTVAKPIYNGEEWVDNVTKELLSLIFKFIQFYGEHFLVNKFTFNKGRENLCPAPQNPAPDRDPADSLNTEATTLNSTGVAIPLYENPKQGITSYDYYAKMMNGGFKNGKSYSANLDAEIAKIDANSANKKSLRQQIKSLKGPSKGGMPPKKTPQVPTQAPPPIQASLEDLEEQLAQMESSEKFDKMAAGLADDAKNFMPVSPEGIPPGVAIPQEGAPSPIGELSWDTFKKYMENYIVNFCKAGQPSLKMVSFLKMMHLNALMMRLGWGFIDLAGGSLMNFLKRRFVVTADYDSKIYFITEGVEEGELRRRFTYIKMCMINLGIEINNYMIDNNFFGDAEIKAQFSFKPRPPPIAPGEMDVEAEGGLPPAQPVIIPLDLLTVLLEPPTGRWFSSRGKEPELFPVPLYSSDMFWSVKLLWVDRTRISLESKIFKSDGVIMSIGYEDLVFKHLEKHFLYKALIGRGVSHDGAMGTIYSTFVSPYNFDDMDADIDPLTQHPKYSKMKTSRWFALRIPSLYEIEYDIKSMLTEPELKNARMAVGKNQKDVDRLSLVSMLKYLISQLHSVGVADQETFFMRYPIASTFIDKILLYFQTDLFQVCCKQVAPGDLKMDHAMLLPPLGIIDNGTNALSDDAKNSFLLPPMHIAPPGTTLEVTQLMRRAVLYSYNTTSKIFMTLICLTKKYGEFKSGADFERARHFQQIDFNVTGPREIGFSLFNYELWVSRGNLQSPIPFENCYVAVFDRTENGLMYNDAGYQVKRGALSGRTALFPQFAQLVNGVQAPAGAPDPSPRGIVDRTFIVSDRIKNTTAETIAAKMDISRLNPLHGSLQDSVAAAKEIPREQLFPRLLGDPPNAPISVYGGGKRRLTKKRARRTSSSSSSLLLFTKRNRPRSLKQKKRTIKKGERKKRNAKKGKSLKK